MARCPFSLESGSFSTLVARACGNRGDHENALFELGEDDAAIHVQDRQEHRRATRQRENERELIGAFTEGRSLAFSRCSAEGHWA